MMSTYYRSCAYKMIQGKSFHRGTRYSFHWGIFKGYQIDQNNKMGSKTGQNDEQRVPYKMIIIAN